MNRYVRLAGYHALRWLGRPLGFRIKPKDVVIENDPTFGRLYEQCAKYTITSLERMYALYSAIDYISRAEIAGDVVECGVWKGGSSKLVAHTLSELNDEARHLYLYDTFAGMTEPTDQDHRLFDGRSAAGTWQKHQHATHNEWAYAPLHDVQKTMWSTGYPRELIHFVQGKVEETIPRTVPDRIALLRLDTDWYESTYHEMVHLYPRLVSGGILIIDDYGCWAGSKAAVDQYLLENNLVLFLHRIDEEGRIAIKP